jgi:hypothetical protein
MLLSIEISTTTTKKANELFFYAQSDNNNLAIKHMCVFLREIFINILTKNSM